MSKKDNNKKIGIIIHLFAWGILFCAPLMFSGATGKQITLGQYILFTGAPLAHLAIFYLNFFILINHFLFKRKLGMFIALNIVLIAGAHLLQMFWWNINFELFQNIPHDLPDHLPPPRTMIILRDSLMFMLTAVLSVAIKVTSDWYKKDNARKEFEKEKSEAELKSLKSQLNPHFLFNTLNNIYSLITINPKQAQDSVHGLSNLLRYVLYDNNEESISLQKELSFMKSYIELMSLRVQDNVKLNINIMEDTSNLKIAPLMFISLVENAFKHGISPTEKSFISIEIFTKPGKKNFEHKVVCDIKNSNFPKDDSDRSGSGIGMENLRKRLDLIYPSKYNLEEKIENGMFFTVLEITLPT